jgi:hypothetical protein
VVRPHGPPLADAVAAVPVGDILTAGALEPTLAAAGDLLRASLVIFVAARPPARGTADLGWPFRPSELWLRRGDGVAYAG